MKDLQGNLIRWQNTRHAVAQVRHACRRASERYGFELTPEDYEKLRQRLIGQFKEQTGIVFLEKDRGASKFAIWHGCEWLPVVYSKKNKTIVTFLPRKVLQAHKHKLPW
jgi:hypothetical protein